MYRLDKQGQKNQIEQYAERMIEREKYDQMQKQDQKALEEFDVFGSGRRTFKEPNEFDNVFDAVVLEQSPPQRKKSDFDDIFD